MLRKPWTDHVINGKKILSRIEATKKLLITSKKREHTFEKKWMKENNLREFNTDMLYWKQNKERKSVNLKTLSKSIVEPG